MNNKLTNNPLITTKKNFKSFKTVLQLNQIHHKQ